MPLIPIPSREGELSAHHISHDRPVDLNDLTHLAASGRVTMNDVDRGSVDRHRKLRGTPPPKKQRPLKEALLQPTFRDRELTLALATALTTLAALAVLIL